MRLRLEFTVAGNYLDVARRFDRRLFEALTVGGFPRVRLERFGGCAVGAEVALSLQAGPLRLPWVSVVTAAAHDEAAQQWEFTDEGRVLPFFLRQWRHRHIVRQAGPGRVAIVEEIDFAAPLGLSALLWPALRAQFRARGAVYRRLFGAALGRA